MTLKERATKILQSFKKKPKKKSVLDPNKTYAENIRPKPKEEKKEEKKEDHPIRPNPLVAPAGFKNGNKLTFK